MRSAISALAGFALAGSFAFAQPTDGRLKIIHETATLRILAPIMPWRAYAGLTKSDVRAIVEYLSNLPAISHKVPGPFGLDEKPAIFRMTILPPEKASQHD